VVGTCPKCGDPEARGDECTHCGASFDATELKDPRSKLTGAKLIRRPTKHWFLRLDLFKDKLESWLETKAWKPNVVNFIKGYIKDLHPRAITRDSTWGVPIPLPDTEGKVLYVWFDAPIGYISATIDGFPDRWKDFWLDPEVKLVNFIGKDNIPFHAAIFPAMVMGQNTPYKLVDELPANEFYKLEGRQFSKSEGWSIDLDDFFTRYTADQIRYAIAANAPETADSEFTWSDFQQRCNAELLGKYGNLVNRVLVFIKNRLKGISPKASDLEPLDQETLEKAKLLVNEIKDSYQNFRLRRAAQGVMELAALGNVYFDAKKPWIDAKEEATKPRMQTTLAICLELIQAMAVVSSPIVPDAAHKIWQMLALKKPMIWSEILTAPFPAEVLLGEPEVLFRRIEDAEVQAEVAKLSEMFKKARAAKAIAEASALKPAIDREAFEKIDLRVGLILKAEPLPKSKKLLKLEVDLGFEKRQILSGIAAHYKPEALIGKKVVVVANLKTAKLMGVESQGMILAGESNETLHLIESEGLLPGSIIS
jgi:methionyl-tRNA synthetase